VATCEALPWSSVENVQLFALAADHAEQKSKLIADHNITAVEYAKLYDATVDGSIGQGLVDVDGKLAVAFGCAIKTKCTNLELAYMQWGAGTVTQNKNKPADLVKSKFVGPDSTTISDGFMVGPNATSRFNQLFTRPEVINYAAAGALSINSDQLQKLFDKPNNISLDGKLTATRVTDFILTNGASGYAMTVMKELYGMDEFLHLFEALRQMIQDYTFGGSTTPKLTLEDLVLGYNDERINYIFQNADDPAADFFSGQEVDINNFITPILSSQSPMYTGQEIGIYTGALDASHVARVRFMNLKDYINTRGPIFDGGNYTVLPLSPTRWLMQFDGATNGMQFDAAAAQKDGSTLHALDQQFMTIFKYTEDTGASDDDKLYGTKSDDQP